MQAIKEALRAKLAGVFEMALKVRLDSMGWNQTDLAEAMGTSRQRVSKIRANPTGVRLGTLSDVAAALGCKLKITFEPMEG